MPPRPFPPQRAFSGSFEHLPMELAEKISMRLKVMANLVHYEADRPQEGCAWATTGEGGVDLRLSFFPVIRAGLGHSFSRGEKIVIRILDPKSRAFDIDQLGFEAGTAAVLKDMLSRPTGMLLLTGPTGSGKTTAIYAPLCHLVWNSTAPASAPWKTRWSSTSRGTSPIPLRFAPSCAKTRKSL